MCRYKDNSIRLCGWDYTNPGIYFVTISTDADICWFGKIKNKKIFHSKLGELANKYWKEIPNHHNSIGIDRYIVMPNHIHGIIIIKGEGIYGINGTLRASCRDVACNVPQNEENKPNINKINDSNEIQISKNNGNISIPKFMGMGILSHI